VIQLIGRLVRRRQDEPQTLRRRAAAAFGRGDNAAGVVALFALTRRGDPAAAFQLGECYEKGIGVVVNFVEAVRWHQHAAEHGHVKAMGKLGDIHLSGRTISIDGSPVARMETDPRKLGCNSLRPAGMSVPQDFAKALHWNRLAAEQGDADAQARLGGQYAAAMGCAQDLAEARKWFLASAEQGCAAGQFGMGALLAGASSGANEIATAAAWFDKAAAQGNMPAKLSLAILLIEGQGLAADPVRAAKLLTEAAQADVTEAMFRLGALYCRPDFDGRNQTLAETWLRRAGTRGHAAALSALTRLLADVEIAGKTKPGAGNPAYELINSAE
jgi:TPR repeat protein